MSKINEEIVTPQQMLEMIGSLAKTISSTQRTLVNIIDAQAIQVKTITSISNSLEKIYDLVKEREVENNV